MIAVLPVDKLFNVFTVNSIMGEATVAGPSALARKYPGGVASKTWRSERESNPSPRSDSAKY